MLYRALLVSIFFAFPLFADSSVDNSSIDYGSIPDFNFKNLDGQDIQPKTMLGKHWLLNFFFTSCPHICPAINGRVATLHREFANNDQLGFVSISIDPERDTPEELKKYAEKFGADHANRQWQLLRGEKVAVRKLIDELHLLASEELDKHTTRLILVSPEGKILKFYRGLEAESFKKLRRDLFVHSR